MAGDWIKVHRSLMDSAVWGDEWLVKLWLWCLMKANHCDANYRGTQVLRGQFITGRNTASDELGVSPSKWYRGIERLVSLGNITIHANSVWTMITVCNYKTYQDDDRHNRTANEQRADSERTANEQRADSERTADDTTSGQPADTSKNYKNSRTQELKNKQESASPAQQGESRSRQSFTKPTVDEVAAYCKERGNKVDPQQFVDRYEAGGWLVGRSPMKDWKAAVRTWERNGYASNQANGTRSLKFIQPGANFDPIAGKAHDPTYGSME